MAGIICMTVQGAADIRQINPYGAPLDTAKEALTKAALWNTRFRR